MDRFLSTATNRIDAKGRVSVPAHFRSVLQQRGYSELYALRGLDIPAFEVGGLDLLDRYDRRIEMEDDPFLQSASDMTYYAYANSIFLKLDQEGRITITDAVRSYTGIESEVTFVGRRQTFQIWEPGRFEAYGAAVIERLRKKYDPAGDGRLGEGAE